MPGTADGANHQLSERADTRAGHGHIGLVVLLSIGLGLVLGLILVLLVFGGSRETVITGLALLSSAAGFATLALLSRRRTDQPQDWARVPAAAFGVAGAAILLIGPSLAADALQLVAAGSPLPRVRRSRTRGSWRRLRNRRGSGDE
jgi:hypothetical protein